MQQRMVTEFEDVDGKLSKKTDACIVRVLKLCVRARLNVRYQFKIGQESHIFYSFIYRRF